MNLNNPNTSTPASSPLPGTPGAVGALRTGPLLSDRMGTQNLKSKASRLSGSLWVAGAVGAYWVAADTNSTILPPAVAQSSIVQESKEFFIDLITQAQERLIALVASRSSTAEQSASGSSLPSANAASSTIPPPPSLTGTVGKPGAPDSFAPTSNGTPLHLGNLTPEQKTQLGASAAEHVLAALEVEERTTSKPVSRQWIAQEYLKANAPFFALATIVEDVPPKPYIDPGGLNIGMGYCITKRAAEYGNARVLEDLTTAGLSQSDSELLVRSMKSKKAPNIAIPTAVSLRLLHAAEPDYRLRAREALSPKVFDNLQVHQQAATTYLAYNVARIESFQSFIGAIKKGDHQAAMKSVRVKYRGYDGEWVDNARLASWVQVAWLGPKAIGQALQNPAKFEDQYAQASGMETLWTKASLFYASPKKLEKPAPTTHIQPSIHPQHMPQAPGASVPHPDPQVRTLQSTGIVRQVDEKTAGELLYAPISRHKQLIQKLQKEELVDRKYLDVPGVNAPLTAPAKIKDQKVSSTGATSVDISPASLSLQGLTAWRADRTAALRESQGLSNDSQHTPSAPKIA